MKKILVSACLYGEIVRYDAKAVSLEDSRFVKWKEEGRLVSACPEVLGGLSVPRSDSQRSEDKIITRDGEDVTKEYLAGAKETVKLAIKNNVVCAIMKERSPSCGSKIIYDGTFSGNKISGMGLTVQLLREAGVIVFNEDELEEVEKML